MEVDKSAVTGDLARRNVYSAVIKNESSDTIHCYVEYRTLSGSDSEMIEFDINTGEERTCEQKVHAASSTGGGDSSFSKVFPKVIYSLQVQRANGSTEQLTAPFDNVPHDDVKKWNFIIDNKQIRSEKN